MTWKKSTFFQFWQHSCFVTVQPLNIFLGIVTLAGICVYLHHSKQWWYAKMVFFLYDLDAVPILETERFSRWFFFSLTLNYSNSFVSSLRTAWRGFSYNGSSVISLLYAANVYVMTSVLARWSFFSSMLC